MELQKAHGIQKASVPKAVSRDGAVAVVPEAALWLQSIQHLVCSVVGPTGQEGEVMTSVQISSLGWEIPVLEV